MKTGLIVDVETTGLDPRNDRIIEIGLLEFIFDDEVSPMIRRMHSALEDPGEPLADVIKKLTRLDDPYLRGQAIDWDIVQSFFSRASIAIAHRAVFDRAFLQSRKELSIGEVHWGCSKYHIDWSGHGFKTTALNYLAADHQFINPFAHRALFDCATTFRLISPHLPELVSRSYQRQYRLIAVNASHDSNAKLKERGYAWDRDKQGWCKEVFEDTLESEKEFLRTHVYVGQGQATYQREEISLNQPI